MDRSRADPHGPPSQRIIYWGYRIAGVAATSAVALGFLGAKGVGGVVMGFAVCVGVGSLATAFALERREIFRERREAETKP